MMKPLQEKKDHFQQNVHRSLSDSWLKKVWAKKIKKKNWVIKETAITVAQEGVFGGAVIKRNRRECYRGGG